MQGTSTIIRQCDESDLKSILPLFAKAYQFNPRLQERDYCDWQFKDTPFSKSEGYSLLVSSDGDRIGGFLGYLPVEFRISNEIRTGCISYNWYADGEDRSGIKLLSELMARYDNVFYLGCTAESEAIFKMFRMPMSLLARWAAVISQDKVETIFGIKDQHGRSQILASDRQINSLASSKGDVHFCKRFDDDEELFFGQWASIKGYIRRTGKYLNWRYVDIPRHNYQIIRDSKGQFAVFRIEQIKGHEEKVIRIVEWNFYGKTAEQALSLIVQQGHQQRAILIDFISSANEIGEHLEMLGFFQASNQQEGIPYLFRPIHYTKDILIAVDLPPHRVQRDFDFKEWYITKGDSDMDRIKL